MRAEEERRRVEEERRRLEEERRRAAEEAALKKDLRPKFEPELFTLLPPAAAAVPAQAPSDIVPEGQVGDDAITEQELFGGEEPGSPEVQAKPSGEDEDDPFMRFHLGDDSDSDESDAAGGSETVTPGLCTLAKRSRQVDVERTDDDAMGEASREGPMLPELSQSVVWYNGQEPTANLDASAGIHSMLQYTTPGKKGETAVPHAPFQTVSGPFRPVEAAPSTLFSALPLFHARHSMPPGVSAAT